MKINYSRSAISIVGEKFNELFNLPVKRPTQQRKPKSSNRFNAWSMMPSQSLCAKAGLSNTPKLSLAALGRFLAAHQDRTRIGESWPGLSLHQDPCVKKMAMLVSETLADMRMIELIYSCTKKG